MTQQRNACVLSATLHLSNSTFPFVGAINGASAPPLFAKSLRKFNLNCKRLNRCRTRPVSKGGFERTWQLCFFNWLSNLCYLVLSNGSNEVRNLIRMALKWIFVAEILQKLPCSLEYCPQTPMALRRLGVSPVDPHL